MSSAPSMTPVENWMYGVISTYGQIAIKSLQQGLLFLQQEERKCVEAEEYGRAIIIRDYIKELKA
jgi:protein-arginine kinase activator protein McsA